MTAAMATIATALAGAALLGGCVSMHDHRGAVIDEQLVSAIQAGVDNKDSIANMLGRPTFTGQFGDSDWYYVSRDTSTVAFRNPRVKQQTVIHVMFDPAGNVTSVQKTGKELIARVDPVGQKTPTLGRKRSFFQDLFGNIGTVNSPTVPGGGGGPY
jgi:outer membrane protein assembly factor BamE (lipoprotein component of BamABCDE complex)